MATVRFDCFIFGYRQYSISHDDLSVVSSRLLLLGVCVVMKFNGRFDARERDRAKVIKALEGLEYTESAPKGLMGRFRAYPHKVAFLAAAFISIFLLVLSSSVVWDIRVEGNERLPEAVVTDILNECGFSIGDFWYQVDKSAVEDRVLSVSSDIGWININQRGTVAYVSIIETEKINSADQETLPQYGNIVATEDCVIEEISVSCGKAAVKVGDVVKKGDVLILGVLPDTAGGGLCRAEGRVVGRVSGSVSVSVDRNYEKKIEKERTKCETTLNFFGFELNIFKLYGNLPESCDIIEEINTFNILGLGRLPIYTTSKHLINYQLSAAEYTDNQLIAVATARLRERTASFLESSDLLRIKTDGSFTETGYSMINYLIYTTNVGSLLSYEVGR